MPKPKLIAVKVVRDVDDIVAKGPACKVRCVGDHMCVCRADVRHVFHVCKRPDCECREALRMGVAA